MTVGLKPTVKKNWFGEVPCLCPSLLESVPKFRQRTLVAARALSSPAACPEERWEEKTEEKRIINL
jgi:hypothetical protein